MTQTLELPEPVMLNLIKVAKAAGLEPSEWIATHLAKCETVSTPEPRTLADLLAGRVGKICSSDPETLSEDCGQKFTDYLVEKRAKGIL